MPQQLRPIALSSHIAKCFVRVLLGRVRGLLAPVGVQQLAGPGRQALDMLWAGRQMFQLVREWGCPAVFLNTDIKKAFDSADRRVIADKLVGWTGSAFPLETRCLLRLLSVNRMSFQLPWDAFELACNVGVRQGSTESPGLFSKLVDVILQEVARPQVENPFPDLPAGESAFMDDLLCWRRNMEHMQAYVGVLLDHLAKAGLVLQPRKCQLVCVGDVGSRVLRLGEVELHALPVEQPMTLMNVPVGTGVSDVELLGFVIEKARGKFFAVKPILQSGAPLCARLRLLDTVVLGCMRWMLGGLFPTVKLQMTLNSFQVWCIRTLMNLKWNGSGVHTEFEIQAKRLARVALVNNGGVRWGNVLIQQYWGYLGHRVRNGVQEGRSVAGILSHFRPLHWWEQQQANQHGVRHGGRHFLQLMNQERSVARYCETSMWRDRALDRQGWRDLGLQFERGIQVSWASGRQPALMM